MDAANLEPFDELIRQLRTHGHLVEAETISILRALAWTSASEMTGELGLAILRIESQCAIGHDDLKQAFAHCMKEIRKIWPHIKLP